MPFLQFVALITYNEFHSAIRPGSLDRVRLPLLAFRLLDSWKYSKTMKSLPSEPNVKVSPHPASELELNFNRTPQEGLDSFTPLILTGTSASSQTYH